MPRSRLFVLGLLMVLVLPTTSPAQHSSLAVSSTVPQLGGCPVFPANNWWNRDISRMPLHPRSSEWLSHMSTSRNLHPDFGPSYGDGPNYGIPITVVAATHRKVSVSFSYASESDQVGYPLGADTKIEGGRNSGGDMHAIIVQSGTCRLYETFATRVRNGGWVAGSGATWSRRPNGGLHDGARSPSSS